MCGIAGILKFGEKPVTRQELEEMTDSLAHRGRDSVGIEIGGVDSSKLSSYTGIGIGHRRLSIIDLSNQATQPMSNQKNNLWIVYNGELYNYAPLKARLIQLGFTFHTESDTEVVLLAYQAWGEKCLQYFNGMFAFAIWDEDIQSLFCARDPIGIKPFYYTLDNSSFRFASESQVFINSDKKQLDPNAVNLFLLTMYVPRQLSIYKSVKKLLPGNYIKIDKSGKFEVKKYWNVPDSGYAAVNPNDAAHELQDLLDKSVAGQLQSDVPVGALLSGGFDSGMIVSSAMKSVSSLHTYSVGFDDGLQFSELEIAKSLSKRYGTTHHERIIRSDEVMSLLDKAICSLSEPVADSAMVPTYSLSQMAAEDGVKVLLSGTGGDEVFGGYSRYIGYSKLRQLYLAAPKKFRNFLGKGILKNSYWGSRLKHSSLDMIMSTGGSVKLSHDLFSNEKEFSVFLNDFASNILPMPESGIPELYEYMHFDLQVYLPDLLLMLLDQLTMAHTVEGRVPYLDVDLIKASYKYKPSLHTSLTETRKIQRIMARGQLDDRTFAAKKQGFSGPVKYWINNNKAQFIDKVMGVKDMPGLEKLQVGQICSAEYSSKNPFWHDQIFSLYCLSTWYHGGK